MALCWCKCRTRHDAREGQRVCSHPGDETEAGMLGLRLVGRLLVGGRDVDCASEPASSLKSMHGARDLSKGVHASRDSG